MTEDTMLQAAGRRVYRSPWWRAGAVVAFMGPMCWIGHPVSFLLTVAGVIAADRWDARHDRAVAQLPLIPFVFAMLAMVLIVGACAFGLWLAGMALL